MATLWLGVAAHAQAPAPAPEHPAAAEPGTIEAAWAPKMLSFTYRGITTHYTCDGLQQKLRNMLTMLGARDVSVRGFGCIRAFGPEPFPGARIRMEVLEPAGKTSASATVSARWQWIDLLARRDPLEVSGDCELIQQFRQSILPAFEPRNIDYQSTCVPRTANPGTVRIRAEVLKQR